MYSKLRRLLTSLQIIATALGVTQSLKDIHEFSFDNREAVNYLQHSLYYQGTNYLPT
jgi:hypothetical protein